MRGECRSCSVGIVCRALGREAGRRRGERVCDQTLSVREDWDVERTRTTNAVDEERLKSSRCPHNMPQVVCEPHPTVNCSAGCCSVRSYQHRLAQFCSWFGETVQCVAIAILLSEAPRQSACECDVDSAARALIGESEAEVDVSLIDQAGPPHHQESVEWRWGVGERLDS